MQLARLLSFPCLPSSPHQAHHFPSPHFNQPSQVWPTLPGRHARSMTASGRNFSGVTKWNDERVKGWGEGSHPLIANTRPHSLQGSATRRCAQLSPTHPLIPAPGTLCFLNSLLKGKKRRMDQNKYGSLDLARVSERNRVVVLTGGGWNSLGSAERLSLCSLSPSHGTACNLIVWFRHKYIILKWATLSGGTRFTGCLSEVNDLRVRWDVSDFEESFLHSSHHCSASLCGLRSLNCLVPRGETWTFGSTTELKS